MRNFDWTETKLIPEVLFFQEGPGVRKWQFRESGVKLLNGGNINNNTLDLSTTSVYLSDEEANGKYSHFLAEAGDFVIACSGITIDKFDKKSAFINNDHLPLCMNTSTMRFRSLDSNVLDIRFFDYYIRSNSFLSQLQRLITGSAQLNFGPSHVKKISLPLPTLEEQKRIAGILDEADRVRKKTQALIDKYDELAQSLFLDMFGQLDIRTTNWPLLTVKEVLVDSKNGAAIKPEEFSASGFPVLHKGAIKSYGGLLIDSQKKTFVNEEVAQKYKNSIIEKNSVVVTLRDLVPTGPSIGMMANLNRNPTRRFLLAQGAYGLELNEKLVTPDFLVFWSNSESYRATMKKYWVGSTQIHLRSSLFFNLQIPLPPLDVQHHFAKLLDSLEVQKTQVHANLEKSEIAFKALLQKAFKGELI